MNMARKRKYQSKSVETTVKPEVEDTPVVIKGPKIPFSAWFDRQVKAGKAKPHQRAALQVFLKKQGLKETESVDDFNSAFVRF